MEYKPKANQTLTTRLHVLITHMTITVDFSLLLGDVLNEHLTDLQMNELKCKGESNVLMTLC